MSEVPLEGGACPNRRLTPVPGQSLFFRVLTGDWPLCRVNLFFLEFQFLMSEVPLYMCLNFEYTVSPGLHYMYT